MKIKFLIMIFLSLAFIDIVCAEGNTLIYGGADAEYSQSVYNDGTHIYVAGFTRSEGSGNDDVLILKLDSNLNILSKKIYGGTDFDQGYAITSDGTYIYVAGYTRSEGSGIDDVLILKLDKNLNLLSKKIYGGASADYGYSIISDGTNIFVGGRTVSEGSGSYDFLVLKLDNNLNLLSKKIYGGTTFDDGYSITTDGINIYLTGQTSSEGLGGYDILILKLDNNLNLLSRKIYGGANSDYAYSITSDGNNIYVAGHTASEGEGSSDFLIMKLDNNLNLLSKKIYGSAGGDYSYSVVTDSSNVYISGFTLSEGAGNRDILILKLDKNLNLLSKKIYGGPGDDYSKSITSMSSNVYITGNTDSETSGGYDLFVWKLGKDFDSYVNSTNSSFEYSNSNLVFNNSSLSFSDSGSTFQDSNLTGVMSYQDSNLVFGDSALTALRFNLNSSAPSTGDSSSHSVAKVLSFGSIILTFIVIIGYLGFN